MARGPRKKPAASGGVSDIAGFVFQANAESFELGIGAPGPPAAAEAKPHYTEHRARLRARFEQSGAEGLPDYELLELLLFRIVPRQDVKPLAKRLIERFGDLGAVLGAAPARIAETPGAGPAVALELKITQAVLQRAAKAEIGRAPIITSWSALLEYCRLRLAHETREQFRVLFLDRKNQLIADEVMGAGTVDHAPVYPREVVRRALELSASALILVHNHPSGDPKPSMADVAITREIASAAKPLDIAVHDHLVVGRHGVASFKSLGLL